jgi:hypothetical protein
MEDTQRPLVPGKMLVFGDLQRKRWTALDLCVPARLLLAASKTPAAGGVTSDQGHALLPIGNPPVEARAWHGGNLWGADSERNER